MLLAKPSVKISLPLICFIIFLTGQKIIHLAQIISLIEISKKGSCIKERNRTENFDYLKDHYSNMFNCTKIRSFDFFLLKAMIGEECNIESFSECPLHTATDGQYHLLSLTEKYDFKTSNIGIGSKSGDLRVDGVIDKKKTQIKIFIQPKLISGFENCAINKEKQIDLLIELFVLIKQDVIGEPLILNMTLGECFQNKQKEPFQIVTNWELSSKKKKHIIYLYRTLKKSFKTNHFSTRLHSLFPNSQCNADLPILELTGILKNDFISYNFQLLSKISCLRKSVIRRYEISNELKCKTRITIYDVISNINLLRQKVNSEDEYMLYIKVFIKTLLKFLQKKVLNRKLSIGCYNKMITWIKELCASLQIELDNELNFDSYLKNSENLVKLCPSNKQILKENKISNNKLELHEFAEATIEDYENIETLLNKI